MADILIVEDEPSILGSLEFVMLPRRNGFEVLKEIRTNRRTAHLPVLVLTAKGQTQDRRTATELGASAFITKPYSNAEVVETVRQLLSDAESLPFDGAAPV